MGGNLPPGYPSFGAAAETSARAAPRCGRVELARAPARASSFGGGGRREGSGGVGVRNPRFLLQVWFYFLGQTELLNLFGQSYTSHAIPDIRIAIRAYL